MQKAMAESNKNYGNLKFLSTGYGNVTRLSSSTIKKKKQRE